MQYRHLSAISRSHPLANEIEGALAVDGRVDLETALNRLLADGAPADPRTLDLIGHATPDHLLSIGDWVIDAPSLKVRAFFRGLADHDVLRRLGVVAVRLVGSATAEGERARGTLAALAEILGIEVRGTTELLCARDFDRTGFVGEHAVAPTRSFDIDALPASPAATGARLLTADDARSFVRLVQRQPGCELPGLLALPRCRVALPRGVTDLYHHVDVLFEYTHVRAGEIVFPIADPHALAQLVA